MLRKMWNLFGITSSMQDYEVTKKIKKKLDSGTFWQKKPIQKR